MTTLRPFFLFLFLLTGSIRLLTPASRSLDTYPGACEPWTQVNDDAFGMGTGADSSYAYEEGFEVLVFDNQLYVGMEADNSFGARLWRTKRGVVLPRSQADWEEVAADADGNPFGVPDRAQNDHIDSLAAFQGYLYVSTANRGSSTLGTRVFRSPTGDPGTWEDAIAAYGPGFGDPDNTNFKDMQVFQGWLCGGTQNWDWANRNAPDWNPGAQVWCTDDGTTWVQKNANGFGDPANIQVWSGYVYGDALYFGVQNYGANPNSRADDVGVLMRTTDLSGTPVWTEVYRGDPGSYRVDILGDLDGFLYISVRSPDGIVILRSATGDPGTWSQVNAPGMNGDPANFGAVVDSATVYNGALYIGVANFNTGVQVWRTTGELRGGPLVDWVQVDGGGLGDPNNKYTELIPFHGYLYAWTSNYVTGQQVRRTKCPICQSRVIYGPGTYTFDRVGAEVTFSAEDLQALEVCVYPGAVPETPPADQIVRRHYEFHPTPPTASLTATLALSYAVDELTTTAALPQRTAYLLRQAAGGWIPCPPEQRGRDPATRRVTCRDVPLFSTWAIATRCPDFVSPPTVAIDDLQALAGRWRAQRPDPGWEPRFDLDDNGRIDVIDLALTASVLGVTCPQP